MSSADNIIRPILTEKSLAQASLGRYTFEVALGASKDVIKLALHEAFGVKVKTVKTAIQKEAARVIAKNRRRRPGRLWKKATVELSEGKISMFETKGTADDKKS